MDKKEKLEELFRDFPGVGPRQAKRFVNSLFYKNKSYLQELAKTISQIKDDLSRCPNCNRFFHDTHKNNFCEICLDPQIKKTKILILEKNSDFENIKKTGLWDGLYFLIGKNLKLTEKNPETKINLSGLIKQIENNQVEEITFALSLNPEGENTKEYIESIIKPLAREKNIIINELGRGLSLGSEIEYSDSITLTEAFKNKRRI